MLRLKAILKPICLCVLVLCVSCKEIPSKSSFERDVRDFNGEWQFTLANPDGAEGVNFDDSQWRTLNVPHDWAIEGNFSAANPSGAGGGALPGGIGWYRKNLEVTQTEINEKAIFIEFDGVYMLSEVYVNGTLVGKRPYGYISFRYDITPYLQAGENVIAVKVDNSQQPNSRWYSGCGIYRYVRVLLLNPIHIDLWGTYVTTPEVTAERGSVNIASEIYNYGSEKSVAEVRHYICDSTNAVVSYSSKKINLPAGERVEISTQCMVNNPILWDTEHPYLYSVRSEVLVNDSIVDSYYTPLGFRTYAFDSEKGFFLNNRPLKLKGVCMHHDLGCLGSAINERAMERQLEILQEMGCNAIRFTHNPPAPEFLTLCDRMGLIVQNESFDMWRKRKTTYDYSNYFNEWHERDLEDFIKRDRNHPSILMWSVGNEVLEQWTHADADTLDIAAANLMLNFKRDDSAIDSQGDGMSVNSLLTQKLCNIVRNLDNRPITTGNNEASPKNHLFAAGTLDIIGYNYQDHYFDSVPNYFPGQPFIITESTSALMTRGYYSMPSDSMIIVPTRWDMSHQDSSYSCSSYDNCHVPWGTTHEKSWLMTKHRDYIGGLFVWTGFDYLGEPTPYDFPARSSYFGIIDLAGFPKDVYYMYQSEWSDVAVLHLFPHWNHVKGQDIDMWCYYNKADSLELFVNGASQGFRSKTDSVLHAKWRVTYEPGNVTVVAYENGVPARSQTIQSAGSAKNIRLTADRKNLNADGKDLSFVTVEVLDENGNLCPWADNEIEFQVEGNAFIAGVDNGSQFSMEPFKSNKRKAFYGKCLVVLQNNGQVGMAQLKASSAGLTDSKLDLMITTKSEQRVISNQLSNK